MPFHTTIATHNYEPWNKGKLVGQKAPASAQGYLGNTGKVADRRKNRDLALFNLAIDSKLRACDLTKLRVREAVIQCVYKSRGYSETGNQALLNQVFALSSFNEPMRISDLAAECGQPEVSKHWRIEAAKQGDLHAIRLQLVSFPSVQ